MFENIRKIFDFMGERRKLVNRSILFGILEALFHALELNALLVALTAIATNNLNTGVIWTTLGLMLASIAGKIVFGHFGSVNRNRSGFYACADKRLEIGDRMKYMPMGYFNENSLGNITARLTTTMFDLENVAPLVFGKMVSGALHAVILTLCLMAFDWRIGLIALVGIVVFVLFNGILRKSADKASPARQAAQANLTEASLEYIQGMSVVKSFGISGAGQKITNAIEGSRRGNTNLEVSMVPPIALQQLALRLFAAAIPVASLIFYFAGTMSLSYCLMFIVASFFIYGPLEMAGSLSSLLRGVGYSIDRVTEVLDAPVMDIGGKDIRPEKMDINCDSVGFSYEKKEILSDMSLSIPENTTTAIVGPSGSGKTTLCHLISRFWDVDRGGIAIGGVDVREYSLDALLSNISMVFQNVYLFNDTIENNIKFGAPNASREQVIKAAKAAQCHDFISILPDGYQTMIGEGGATISGGEKQRISIARALLKDAPIIILDEATANIDPENEEKLQAAIEALTHGKTIIMIAHRLKTVRNADQIIVLDEGRIVQRGTHRELISESGIYRNFISVREQAVGWKVGNTSAS